MNTAENKMCNKVLCLSVLTENIELNIGQNI